MRYPFSNRKIIPCYRDYMSERETDINVLSKKYGIDTDIIRLIRIIKFLNDEIERQNSSKTILLLDYLDLMSLYHGDDYQ